MTLDKFSADDVTTATEWAMSQDEDRQERLFTNLFQAVADYKTTRDAAILERFAGDLVATFRIHQVPGYDEAMAAAPTEPSGERRSVKEVIAELSGRWSRAPEPTLAEIAFCMAEREGSPLAARPHLILRAADKILAEHPDADADDVLHLAARWL